MTSYTILVMIAVGYPLVAHCETLAVKWCGFLFLVVRVVGGMFCFLFRCSCSSASRRSRVKRVYFNYCSYYLNQSGKEAEL